MEVEVDGKLEFLDTVVNKSNSIGNGLPIFNLRERETNKGLYFNYESCIPNIYKFSLVKCLVNTAVRVCSTWPLFHAQVQRLTNIFMLNGYPKGVIQHCVAQVLQNFLCNKNTDAQGDDTRISTPNKHFMILPYLGKLSDDLKHRLDKIMAQAFPSVDFKVIFKKNYCIRDLFIFKDVLPLSCRSWVVYKSQCDSCSAVYIGKTINLLHQRFYKSPNGHLYKTNRRSELYKHKVENPTHNFSFDDVKILDTAPNNNGLLEIKETIYIQLLKPSLTIKTSTPMVLF